MDSSLLLIDGSSMLVTNYYGNLPKKMLFEKDPEKKKLYYSEILHAADGTYTNAIYGMLRTILKIIEEQKPTHIAVAFDKTRDTFRRKMYSEYKGNRSETPDPLKQQFVLMEQLLSDIGIKVLISDEYEADDLIGTVAHKFAGKLPIRVMTKDHDYLQLVSDEYNIRAWMVQTKQENCDELFNKYYSVYGITKKDSKLPDKVFEYTDETVYQEEGVYPSQIVDLKGIVGDTSDNIPGVKGISSAAIPLLREYGTVENLYESIEDEGKSIEDFWKDSLGIKKGNLKKLTAEGAKESAMMSKKLATIVDAPDSEIKNIENIESLELTINEDKLFEYCKRLGFRSILEKKV